MPKTKIKFWEEKFQRNQTRDRENIDALKAAGWSVGIIWECETRSIESVENFFHEILRPDSEQTAPAAPALQFRA